MNVLIIIESLQSFSLNIRKIQEALIMDKFSGHHSTIKIVPPPHLLISEFHGPLPIAIFDSSPLTKG